MALQSSGQISLSQIAAEFGGSAPHALSEYYGDGNAPSSGEIQLAADFYGTSAVTYAANTTITSGSQSNSKGESRRGYDPTSPAMGSIGSRAISNSSNEIDEVYTDLQSASRLRFHLYNNTAYTAWTFIEIVNGSTVTRWRRADASLSSHGTTGAIFHHWNATASDSPSQSMNVNTIWGSAGTTVTFRIAI